MSMVTAEELREICTRASIENDVPMSRHTTMRTGGPAELLVTPDESELTALLPVLTDRGIPYTVLGHGSNVLVSDRGIPGVTIIIGRPMADIKINGNEILCGAGASLGAIAGKALDASLKGFEFAAGIPGSLGGACVMNAGAYGGEMKDVLTSVRVFDPDDGAVKTIPAADLDLSYRHSIIPERGYIVLSASIRLVPGDLGEIRSYMDELAKRRKEKQPLEYPSAGSTFKRPEGHFAGKLIEEAGLKGFHVGDARVSDKHCGFVINTGSAISSDVYDLIGEVIARVYERSGIKLEPEIKFIGDFS